MKIAFVYPGQGVQKAGMGADFYEKSAVSKQIFDEASKAIGIDMKELCFFENENLDKTEYTQAALVTTYNAMTAELLSRGVTPSVTGGLSLGEYSALVTSGALTSEDAVKLVRIRGQLMQNAVPLGVGSMAAIIGLSSDQVNEVVEKIEGCWVANYNCPGQIVITGYKDAVQEAATALSEKGAKRAVVLNVSGPFHSPLLSNAGKELEEYLNKTTISDLKIPYASNVLGDLNDSKDKITSLLTSQVYSSVRWEESIRKMIDFGTELFIEIGPGKTVAGFIRKTDSTAKVINVSSFEDVDAAVLAIKEM